MANKYICAARCPDLDNVGEEHCKCEDKFAQGICPYGNQPIWITLACEIGGTNERTCDN